MTKQFLAAAAAASALALTGCVTDDYGYGGMEVGYNTGYYGGSPYWGWYDDYYYPGVGYYVYDRGGRRHAWNDGQRRYWEGRRGPRGGRANWSGLRERADDPAWQARRDAWRAQHPQQGATDADRAQRREAWRAQRMQQGQQQRQEGASAPRVREGSAEQRGRGSWNGRRRGE